MMFALVWKLVHIAFVVAVNFICFRCPSTIISLAFDSEVGMFVEKIPMEYLNSLTRAREAIDYFTIATATGKKMNH